MELERGKAGGLAAEGASALNAGRYCGREFSSAEMARIHGLLQLKPALNRTGLSRRICQDLNWRNQAGALKEMSCRVALLRMEKDGLLQLPKPLKGNGNGRTRPVLTSASDPQEAVRAPVGALEPLRFASVQKPRDSRLWNELIQRHHYLGYTPLSGAQMRYLVWSGTGRLLAALGFSASAWQIKPRDQYIGWDDRQRRQGLPLIVNQARFLILPWVQSPSLASRILAGMIRPLAGDWKERYGYEPVLLETFVESARFAGTSYRAANWICVGQTQGRGKLEQNHRRVAPIKSIWLYPLKRNFREVLCA